jgi:hypothetical protein
MNTLTINLPRKDKEHLEHLALQYGLSLPEFSRKVLHELSSNISEESFDDYENPNQLKASYQRALKDWKVGRVSSKL